MENTYPILVGDVGGTKSRFGIIRLSSQVDSAYETIEKIEFKTQEYKSFSEVLGKFLEVFE